MTKAKKSRHKPGSAAHGGKSGAENSANRHPWLASYPSELAWDHKLTARPLTTLLDDTVAKYADRSACYFLGRRMTYGQIGALVEQAACGLAQLGVGPGTKVGLLLPNSPTYIIYFYAALKTGATVVNFNPLYSIEELDFQTRDSGTSIMVTLDLQALFPKVEKLLERGSLKTGLICSFAALLPSYKAILFRLLKSREIANVTGSDMAASLVMETELLANDGNYTPAKIDEENDIAVLQYTGGTTGTPKGAMLTHANLSINIEQVRLWASNLEDGEEKIMGILPFFHVFAMTTVLNLGVAMGSELILMPKFELDDALKLIDKIKPSILPGVPTLYNAMMNHKDLAKYDLSTLKFCISGGAALPLEVKRGFEAVSPCKLVEGYGLSETSPVATSNPLHGPTREGSIGIPVPQTKISIRDIDDPEKELSLGENGEICISGPQVMKGYWNNPDETRDTFTGEYFRSGDVGYMDEDGFTYIVDRLKDMIIASGFNIYPRRIEEAIYEYPAVEEVTVVGIPDDYRGEAPKAFIKLRAGQSASADDILVSLEDKLSKLEMPSEIEFRDELPKTMIGKLSKKELREQS